MKGSSGEDTYVAFLRGVNVGGKNRLPMQALAAMFVAAGCTGVSTYIQSGNVIFRAKRRVAERVQEAVTAAVTAEFGFISPVVVRSREEMQEVLERQPYPVSDEDMLHVYFLKSEPALEDVDTLDQKRSPGDEFLVRGRDIYARLGNGMAKTKLTNAYFDSKLKTVSTARNWRTVMKLVELMG